MNSKSPVVAWIGIPRAPHIHDRKLWSLSIALSVAGFGLFALYRQEHVSEFSSKLRRAVRAGRNAVDVMTKLTEISHTVLSDVHLYLESNTDAVPQSLRQVSALLSTQEFRGAMRSLVMAFFEGLALSGGERTSLESQPVFENLVERIIVRATRRPDLLSIAVRLATRHAADELLQILNVLKSPLNGTGASRSRGNTPLDVLIARVATENGRKVMSSVVTAFTSTLVTVCIEKSRGVNTWDDVFQVIARPANLRVIHQLAGVSSREFARSMIDSLADVRPRTIIPRGPITTEITADVDYSIQPAPVRRTEVERSPASQAVSNLVDSFVTVAHNEESRRVLYQFCGYAVAEVIKVLFLDFVRWFRQSVFADLLKFCLALVYEFLLFCSIPLVHTLTTSLSIQSCPAEG